MTALSRPRRDPLAVHHPWWVWVLAALLAGARQIRPAVRR